ncbi:Fpg/Nei family DNA glycosylase [Actinacidiphila acidipaludis]|uniref:Fpg/Nei family DNA glycosylase n=1 Tax=Actinacidiphila acidipaludis TaxID=2873382 RepID=A0ABS7QFQ5_9ACTN|nr:DNA-formamidopyrimidine glycosylase family protein [Streptomyces acidipaludis]MBY8881982.1 Fpg/Nei family DNA glycosylase [Streptomyces acidipaludis]
MPELPDVEGFRDVLDSCGTGRRVEKVEVADAGVLRGVSAARLRRALEGRRLAAPERRGKYLILRTDGDAAVLLHFGMTGRLLCCSPGEPAHRYDRVRFGLTGGRDLRYQDQRKLQGLRLADDEAAVERALAGQGPDALSLDREPFLDLLAGRRARIKTVLMDQSVLAGLGNLLADEILWRARVHPARPADRLSAEEGRHLYGAMRQVLRLSVRAGRVPGRPSWLTGHREGRERTCPRCSTSLGSIRVSGRTTVFCPHCQPRQVGPTARRPRRAGGDPPGASHRRNG